MVACCRCNRTGSCRGCACAKAGNSCSNCLPSKLGTCQNVSTTPVHTQSTAPPDTPQTPNTRSTAPPDTTRTPNATMDANVTDGATTNALSEPTPLVNPATSDLPSQPAHSNPCPPQLPAFQPMHTPDFSWGTHNADDFIYELEAAYSEVVHWKLNSFLVRLGKNSSVNCPAYSQLSRLPLQWNQWPLKLLLSCPSCYFKSLIVVQKRKIMSTVWKGD